MTRRRLRTKSVIGLYGVAVMLLVYGGGSLA